MAITIRDPNTFQRSYDATQALFAEVNAAINLPALFAAAKAADPSCDSRTLLYRHGLHWNSRDEQFRTNLLNGTPFSVEHYQTDQGGFIDAWGDQHEDRHGLKFPGFDLYDSVCHWLDWNLRNEGKRTVLRFGHGKAASASFQWEKFSDPYDPTKPFEAADLKSKLLDLWTEMAGGFGTDIKLSQLKEFLDKPDAAVSRFMHSVSPIQNAEALDATPVRTQLPKRTIALIDLSKS